MGRRHEISDPEEPEEAAGGDPHQYRERSAAGRFRARAERFRRVATRYERRAAHFLALAWAATLVVMMG